MVRSRSETNVAFERSKADKAKTKLVIPARNRRQERIESSSKNKPVTQGVSIPRVSLKGLHQGSFAELANLEKACKEVGFVYMTDFGVSQKELDKVYQVSREFFALPLHLKKTFDHSNQTIFPNNSRGYVSLYSEILHPSVGADNKESFDLGAERELGGPFVGPTNMPSNEQLPNFRATLFGMQEKVINSICPTLLESFAQILGFEPTYFFKCFKDPNFIQRIIRYPPQHSFAGKHTDGGLFTLLFQEELTQPSLRAKTKEGGWLDVKAEKDTFVLNIGDMLQKWSAGMFISLSLIHI